MKTSVRNQWLGTVQAITKGAINSEILLSLKGGDNVVAQITNSSVDSLGLAPGSEAWVLVKSSWIALATGKTPPRLSTRNVLGGTVQSIKTGAVNSEVALQLPGGETITSVITEESVKNLELSPGVKAWALFKSSAVIVAVN